MYEPTYTYSLEQYWKLTEMDPEHRYEYVDGHIRMMSRGSLPHAQLGANIIRLLGNALLNSDCNVYSSDASVQLTERRCYIPDVTVSCDPHDWTRKDALESPTVVVEVLSPYTERIDKGEKLAWYQHYPSIQEILFVDSRKRYVEHHHRIGDYKWETSFYEREDDVIDLASVEASLTVGEIYFKVYLELEEVDSETP